jgi:hypothetical protein
VVAAAVQLQAHVNVQVLEDHIGVALHLETNTAASTHSAPTASDFGFECAIHKGLPTDMYPPGVCVSY